MATLNPSTYGNNTNAFPLPAAAKRWRIIALTNNYSKSETMILGTDEASAPPKDLYPNFSLEKELEFLGWTEGATPPKMRALFDDFCDSSSLGMRYSSFTSSQH